jgi:DNA-binding protein H-NS
MAAKLAKLEVPALLKLRDQIEARLSSMKDTLTAQLASLGIGTPAKRGRKRGKRAHALKGTKRPAKFRDPATGKTWAGVGMTPLWIKRYEENGRPRDQFVTGVSDGGQKAATRKDRKPKRAKKAARK